MSQDPLDGIRAKLNRADRSLRTLDDKLSRLADSKPLRVGIDVDFQSGWNTAYIEHVEPLPVAFSVLVGESLYHGRSVLEHLVWALVKANHKKPGRDHTFPIWDRSPEPRGDRDAAAVFIDITKRKHLAGVPIAAIALIESLQPYTRGNEPGYVLSILDGMARDDRHHTLHASFVAGRDAPLDHLFKTYGRYRITEFRNLMHDGRRLVHGTKVARFRVHPLTRNPKVYVEGDFPVFIAFGDSKAQLLIGTFKKINTDLRKLLRLFEKFL